MALIQTLKRTIKRSNTNYPKAAIVGPTIFALCRKDAKESFFFCRKQLVAHNFVSRSAGIDKIREEDGILGSR